MFGFTLLEVARGRFSCCEKSRFDTGDSWDSQHQPQQHRIFPRFSPFFEFLLFWGSPLFFTNQANHTVDCWGADSSDMRSGLLWRTSPTLGRYAARSTGVPGDGTSHRVLTLVGPWFHMGRPNRVMELDQNWTTHRGPLHELL